MEELKKELNELKEELESSLKSKELEQSRVGKIPSDEYGYRKVGVIEKFNTSYEEENQKKR